MYKIALRHVSDPHPALQSQTAVRARVHRGKQVQQQQGMSERLQHNM